MVIHQCAIFLNNPRLVPERDARHITSYLASTSTYVYLQDNSCQLYTQGIIYRPNKAKGIECYVDADFDGGWYQEDSNNA